VWPLASVLQALIDIMNSQPRAVAARSTGTPTMTANRLTICQINSFVKFKPIATSTDPPIFKLKILSNRSNMKLRRSEHGYILPSVVDNATIKRRTRTQTRVGSLSILPALRVHERWLGRIVNLRLCTTMT
jgi:hypothetical protein